MTSATRELLVEPTHALEVAPRVLLVDDSTSVLLTTRRALEKAGFSVISRLRELGFRIALDDLGAGYAGLTSFALLEPEFVKLDMALIRDVDANRMKQRIVRSMVQLCHDMGKQIVAEGIETEREREVLVDLGWDLLQGYLFARPGRPFPMLRGSSRELAV